MDVHLRLCAAVVGIVALFAPPGDAGASPRRPADDCLASVTPRECHDEDGGCDLQAGPGCLMSSTLCFNTGPGDEGCAHRGIDDVRVARPLLGGPRGGLARAVLDALIALGGSEEKRSVSFADEPMQVCADFEVFVPRKGKRAGRAFLATRTRADGSSDLDRTAFTCLPPDPTSDRSPPLSSGCRSTMDETECEAHDGEFAETAGASHGPHCFCRTDDFGETCTHNRQCQGDCLAATPSATSGTCSEHASAFGCFLMFLFEGSPSSVCVD
jgi:hypothetical protein